MSKEEIEVLIKLQGGSIGERTFFFYDSVPPNTCYYGDPHTNEVSLFIKLRSASGDGSLIVPICSYCGREYGFPDKDWKEL